MGKFTLRRGLSEVFAAEVLVDNENTYSTGATFHLIPAGRMSRDVNRDVTDNWFDDNVFAQSGTEGATDVAIEGASVRETDLAEILGKDIDSTTGAVLDAGEYVEKYYALGGKTKNIDGTETYFWFMKGTFSVGTQEDKTEDDTTDTNGTTLNFKAIKTIHKFTDGKRRKKVHIDTYTTQIKSEKTWTAQVVTPDNLATICEKIIPLTGITLSDSTATVAADGTKQLTATLAPTGATGTVSWYTTDAAVATVSATGLVTGVSAGTAIITAVCDNFAASCTVTVTE